MKRLIKNLKSVSESPYVKKLGYVFSGTALSQLLPVLGSLILARIFLPASFGVYSLWLGYVMLISTISTGRLEQSFGNESLSTDRITGLMTSLMMVLLVVLILASISCVTLIFVPSITEIMGLSQTLIMILFPAIVFHGFSNSLQSFYAIIGEFSTLIRFRIYSAFSLLSMQIILGIISASPESLGLAHVLAGAILVFFIIPILKAVPLHSLKKQNMLVYIKKHRKFLYFSLPADTVNSFSAQVPLLYIGQKFGNELLGYFSLTVRVLGAPLALIGRAALDVFKAEASEQFQKYRNCRQVYKSTVILLFYGSLIFAVTGYLAFESLFPILFGQEWSYSAQIAIWLLPLFSMRFIASPLSHVFYLAGKQLVDLIWQGALLISILSVFILGEDFKLTVLSYSFTYSILYIVYLGLSSAFASGEKNRHV